jgi:plasmid stability protein
MYIHRVRRTQLYLDEGIHQRLRALAARQGRTVSDLVREAVARAYGAGHVEERLSTLDGITSLWHDRDDLGATDAYVRRVRRDTRRRRRPSQD